MTEVGREEKRGRRKKETGRGGREGKERESKNESKPPIQNEPAGK